jgi:hypothetical protein
VPPTLEGESEGFGVISLSSGAVGTIRNSPQYKEVPRLDAIVESLDAGWLSKR